MKKIKMLFLIIGCFYIINFQNVYADSIVKDFDLETGLDIVQDVQRETNGNIVVGGMSSNYTLAVEKYNSERELIWHREVPDYEAAISMVVDEEGNVYAIAETHDEEWIDSTTGINISCNYVRGYIVKIDNSGNVVFKKTIDSSVNNYVSPSVIRYQKNRLYILTNNMDNLKVENCSNGQCERSSDAKNCVYILDKNGNTVKKIDAIEIEKYREKYTISNNHVSECGNFWGLTRENNFISDESGVYFTVSSYDLSFRYGKLDFNNKLLWSKKVFKDEEKFLFGSSQDIAFSNDGNIIIAGSTADEYTDITESVREWYTESEEIPEYLCYDTVDLPSFVKINKNGDVLERVTIDSQGGRVFNVRNQDNGYYAAMYLTNLNVEEIENTKRGYYFIRYDYDFNVKDAIELSGLTFSTNDIDSGVFIFNGGTVTRYYTEESEDIEEKSIVFMSKKNNYMNDVFKDLSEEQIRQVRWKVEDTEIAKVEDGIIIPLKAGKTDIVGVYKRKDYVVHLEVKNDMINPLTANNTVIFIALIITIMLVLSIIIKNRHHKKDSLIKR